jgi:predicted ATP-dependent protease
MSIEREVCLFGRSHDKGAMNVAAYLRASYLPNYVCALHATLCFDQVHDEVDGDSASLAELLVLLSSLSQQPLHQTIAVTGAVDQRGNVQAVGGINEKIEGFFRVCKQKGFNGQHGVIIPKSTMSELALKSEVLEAVKAGLFRIWAISHVDEALLLMTQDQQQLTQLLEEQNSDQPTTRLSALEKLITPIQTAVHQRLKELSKLAAEHQSGQLKAYKSFGSF